MVEFNCGFGSPSQIVPSPKISPPGDVSWKSTWSGSKKSLIWALEEMDVLDLTKIVLTFISIHGSTPVKTAVKLTADSINVFEGYVVDPKAENGTVVDVVLPAAYTELAGRSEKMDVYSQTLPLFCQRCISNLATPLSKYTVKIKSFSVLPPVVEEAAVEKPLVVSHNNGTCKNSKSI